MSEAAVEIAKARGEMTYIDAPGAPAASGHYSHAVAANGFVFVAGQLPLHPETRAMPAGARAQTTQALSNAAAILEAAGSGIERTVAATVFITDIEYWPEVDAAWAHIFGEHRPSQAVAVSPRLHFDCLVEIQLVAIGR